jgi:hypothetical protein
MRGMGGMVRIMRRKTLVALFVLMLCVTASFEAARADCSDAARCKQTPSQACSCQNQCPSELYCQWCCYFQAVNELKSVPKGAKVYAFKFIVEIFDICALDCGIQNY